MFHLTSRGSRNIRIWVSELWPRILCGVTENLVWDDRESRAGRLKKIHFSFDCKHSGDVTFFLSWNRKGKRDSKTVHCTLDFTDNSDDTKNKTSPTGGLVETPPPRNLRFYGSNPRISSPFWSDIINGVANSMNRMANSMNRVAKPY
jgi:hypothetical protein